MIELKNNNKGRLDEELKIIIDTIKNGWSKDKLDAKWSLKSTNIPIGISPY